MGLTRIRSSGEEGVLGLVLALQAVEERKEDMVLRVGKDVGEIELLKGLCGQPTDVGSELWEGTGNTGGVDEAVGSACEHGDRHLFSSAGASQSHCPYLPVSPLPNWA